VTEDRRKQRYGDGEEKREKGKEEMVKRQMMAESRSHRRRI
jgi:hypothetical protein